MYFWRMLRNVVLELDIRGLKFDWKESGSRSDLTNAVSRLSPEGQRFIIHPDVYIVTHVWIGE